MTEQRETVSVTELQAKMNRHPTAEEIKKIKQNVKFFEKINKYIFIEDGFKFIAGLRKEARRQKAMKVAGRFEEQAKKIQDVPNLPSHSIERQLADSFEIYEED